MDDEQQQAQHDDELMAQRDAMEALKHARSLGLGESECMAIAYCAGIANDFYREIRK